MLCASQRQMAYHYWNGILTNCNSPNGNFKFSNHLHASTTYSSTRPHSHIAAKRPKIGCVFVCMAFFPSSYFICYGLIISCVSFGYIMTPRWHIYFMMVDTIYWHLFSSVSASSPPTCVLSPSLFHTAFLSLHWHIFTALWFQSCLQLSATINCSLWQKQ